jgi:hypothetical protein
MMIQGRDLWKKKWKDVMCRLLQFLGGSYGLPTPHDIVNVFIYPGQRFGYSLRHFWIEDAQTNLVCFIKSMQMVKYASVYYILYTVELFGGDMGMYLDILAIDNNISSPTINPPILCLIVYGGR